MYQIETDQRNFSLLSNQLQTNQFEFSFSLLLIQYHYVPIKKIYACNIPISNQGSMQLILQNTPNTGCV